MYQRQDVKTSTLPVWFRWCTGSVREVSTRWYRPASARRGWISERWTSSFASMHRRTPSAWCSEWDGLDVRGRDALLSFWQRDVRRGWVLILYVPPSQDQSSLEPTEILQTHRTKLLPCVSLRRTTRARATSAVYTSPSPATKAVSTCTPTVPACCPRASTPPYTRCTLPVASLTTGRVAGDLSGVDVPIWRGGPRSSTLRTWVSVGAGVDFGHSSRKWK